MDHLRLVNGDWTLPAGDCWLMLDDWIVFGWCSLFVVDSGLLLNGQLLFDIIDLGFPDGEC